MKITTIYTTLSTQRLYESRKFPNPESPTVALLSHMNLFFSLTTEALS